MDILHLEGKDLAESFVRTTDGGRYPKKQLLDETTESGAELARKVAAQRNEERTQCEARFQDVASRFVKLNEELRNETKQRVDFIVHEAKQDAIQLATLWEAREKYRMLVENRNASLQYTLKRAADAKIVARAAEQKAAEEAAVLAEKLRKEEEKKNAKQKKK